MRTQNMTGYQADAVAEMLESINLQEDYKGSINRGGCGIWAMHFSNMLLNFGYKSKMREVLSDEEEYSVITDKDWCCGHILVDVGADEQFNMDCDGYSEEGCLSELPRTLVKYALANSPFWNSSFIHGGLDLLKFSDFMGNPLAEKSAAREVLSKHMWSRMNELYVPKLKKILWR